MLGARGGVSCQSGFPVMCARNFGGKQLYQVSHASCQYLIHYTRNLPPTIGFFISKGGITSNDVLSDGLALYTARVVGQILARCSVVCCPRDHSRYPDLPVVIFPGNVGDEQALVTVFNRLTTLA